MLMRFQVVIEPPDRAPFSAIARIPFDPTEVWPDLTKLRIQGSICRAGSSDEPYKIATSLMKVAPYGCFLLVTGKMRKATGLTHGSLAEIVLEPAMDESAATPPPQLAKLLRQDRSVKKWFEALNYSTRKYICEAIQEPKSADARTRRAEQWVERFMLTMEGEEVTPPILRAAFRRQPLAQAGWESMTAIRKRLVLLSIFTCQSPESQAKRVELALEEAMNKAQQSKQHRETDIP
jgi:uncharacterized protein YdeI (YjbR/CyaY-like superfamily)